MVLIRYLVLFEREVTSKLQVTTLAIMPADYDQPMPDTPEDQPERSPLAQALAAVGDRWTLLVVEALLEGPRRFNDLQEQIAGIAPNILAERLRRLEREGLAVAQPYSERPPRYVYELTVPGRELAGVLTLLSDWGAGQGGHVEPARHEVCGTPLEVRWYCPTCEQPVDAPDESGLHFA
jgi:DNA-binding HxlR family transcriptional regulator